MIAFNAVIQEVRNILQDNNSDCYRYKPELLDGYANQALQRIALLRPDLFIETLGDGVVDAFVPAVGSYQRCPPDSIRIMDVFGCTAPSKKTCGAIEVSRKTMDESIPGWPLTQFPEVAFPNEGEILNWMRNARDPNSFFVWPPMTDKHTLSIAYAQSPRTYKGDEQIILLPDAYFPAVVDGTVFVAETMEDEAVNSNRAKLYYQSMTDLLGVSLKNRPLIDVDVDTDVIAQAGASSGSGSVYNNAGI